jgi:O-methyltransferase involved in polyketide biosynthesis
MTNRDYTSISPTAQGLLFMKAITTSIPYLKEAAELILGQGGVEFECRYLSIDQVLIGTPITNFLEIASGFSFRSLAMTRDRNCFYLDTDLPEIIETKMGLGTELLRAEGRTPERSPHFIALNALDPDAFSKAIEMFPPGPITVISEGLLVYLDETEKRQLCSSIRQALIKRGGTWVSADIYTRKGQEVKARPRSQQVTRFLAQHKVVENSFADFDAAWGFFTECGFQIEKHANDEVYGRLSSLESLKKVQEINEAEIRARLNTRQTWVLTAKS